jgi:hypothetical protein
VSGYEWRVCEGCYGARRDCIFLDAQGCHVYTISVATSTPARRRTLSRPPRPSQQTPNCRLTSSLSILFLLSKNILNSLLELSSFFLKSACVGRGGDAVGRGMSTRTGTAGEGVEGTGAAAEVEAEGTGGAGSDMAERGEGEWAGRARETRWILRATFKLDLILAIQSSWTSDCSYYRTSSFNAFVSCSTTQESRRTRP